jgi:hypothetical protein
MTTPHGSISHPSPNGERPKPMTQSSLAAIALALTDEDRFVPTTYVGKLEPNYFCRGWNARREKYCRNRAGSGCPAHQGRGRCKFHGGTRQGDPRVRHGRHSAPLQTIGDLLSFDAQISLPAVKRVLVDMETALDRRVTDPELREQLHADLVRVAARALAQYPSTGQFAHSVSGTLCAKNSGETIGARHGL